MTAVQLAAPTQVVAIEHRAQRAWTRRKVIRQIMNETGYSRQDVVAFVNSIVYHIREMIEHNETSWRPHQQWLDTHHGVFVAVVPDNTISVSGSTHRGIEEIAKPDGFMGVITLGHDMQGEVLDCYVHVTSRSARFNN